MKLRTASALAALAATLVVAGGGSPDAQTTPSPRAEASPPQGYDYGTSKQEAPAAESKTGIAAKLSVANGMLVDATGRTLYVWEADQGDQSACDGACAQAWPPLTTNAKPQAGDGVQAALLGTS